LLFKFNYSFENRIEIVGDDFFSTAILRYPFPIAEKAKS